MGRQMGLPKVNYTKKEFNYQNKIGDSDDPHQIVEEVVKFQSCTTFCLFVSLVMRADFNSIWHKP